MKKFFCILLVFISCILHGEDFIQDLRINSKIASDIEYLRKFFPSKNNSAEEQAVYQFIRDRLNSLSIPYIEQPLDTIRGAHSFNTNIIVDFAGKTNDTIIYAFPVNNLRDNSFNIAIALQLCEFFSKNTPEKSVKIVFLGSEYFPSLLDTNYLLYDQSLVEKITSGSRKAQLGSRVFLQEFFPESDVSLIYFNVENYENIIEISNATRIAQTPLWFIKKASREMRKNNINFFIDLRKNNLYKAGYSLESQIDLFMQNNIPALYITSGDNYNKRLFYNRIFRREQRNSVSQLISFLISMSDDYPKLDREINYLILPFKNNYFFLKEKYNILISLVFVLLLLVLAMKYSNNFYRYCRKLFKNFWVIIWLFLLCFLFLFLATLFTEFILWNKGTPNIWIENPVMVFFIKTITAIVFLFLSLFLLEKLNSIRAKRPQGKERVRTSRLSLRSKIKLPYSSSFYSSSAIFLMLINLVIFLFLNITLAPIIMWGLFWTIVFSFSTNRLIKIGCLVISYYFIFDILIYILTVPAINLCSILISSKIAGNLLIAATLLPGIMMILRILHIRTYSEFRKLKILRRIAFIVTLLVAITLIGYYYQLDIYKNKKMPVLVVHTIDMNTNTSTVKVSAPVRIGDIEISKQGNNFTLAASSFNKIEFTNNNAKEMLEVEKTLSRIMDRKNIVLDIIPKGNPEQIEVFFQLGENQIIMDSNYQFTLESDLRRGEFHIGYNPDFPLKLDILIEGEANILFEIKLIYRISPFYMNIKGNNMIFYDYTVVKKSIYG
ncbi:MAG: hypothetical protein FWC36_03455 [Spirochaetes bacterium]|nr:hypothetical protein [Spirochaetota bacterium]